METISSAQNTQIKYIVKLHNSKYRKEYNQSIVEGKRSVKAFLESNIKVTHIYINEQNYSLIEDLNINSYKQDPIITLVSDNVMSKISTQKTSSGIVAIFNIPDQPSWNNLSSGLVLVQINNPGNMGTLIRSSVAVQANNIIIIEGTDPWSPKVIQSTSGHIAFANIYQATWPELISHKKNNKFNLYALVVKNGQPIKNVNKGNSLIIIGNEAHGIPQEYLDQCDSLITLPMPGGTESLNAAIAGSIAMYLIHIYQ